MPTRLMLHPGRSRLIAAFGMRVLVIVALHLVAGCEHRYTTHQITLTEDWASHPDSTTRTLTVRQTIDGEPIEYAMDVRSVACLDTECRIITVRLFWDPLGAYTRYELPPGSNLTKNDHVVFNRDDHRRLHRLLSDPQSLVERVDPQELLEAQQPADAAQPFDWRNPEYGVDGADAATTPTPVDLEPLVVPGAAYTSLTLWHWANGQVPVHIRRITRETASRRQLLQWLGGTSRDDVRFALEALAHRRMFDDATIAAVLARCRNSGPWMEPAWRYLTSATPEPAKRLKVYESLIAAEPVSVRTFVLEKLADEKAIPDAWHDALADFPDRFETYYEFHLFLDLLSTRKLRAPQIIEALSTHLRHPNPAIRRAVREFVHGPATILD